MKLALRIFALTVAVASVAAAATPPKTSSVLPSHLSATSHMPSPESMPGPWCCHIREAEKRCVDAGRCLAAG